MFVLLRVIALQADDLQLSKNLLDPMQDFLKCLIEGVIGDFAVSVVHPLDTRDE